MATTHPGRFDCSKNFKRKEHFVTHLKTHDPDAQVKCGICCLQVHTVNIHSSGTRKRFPCPFDGCEKTYLDQHYVEMHIKIDHAENPYKFSCILCGKEFKRKTNFLSHIYSHTKEKPYKCSTCGKSFATKTHLGKHEVCHMEKSLRPSSVLSAPRPSSANAA
ncbi:zinc finger protein 394 [Folsomia candida]|uniref:zinc finger protein 394 n=1 Tax=Folsomia candida TaxID=158441 RepID=UPI001605116C|nr:zinc finger protein 394 [Folsomia candida]